MARRGQGLRNAMTWLVMLACGGAMFTQTAVDAGEFNEVLSIGDQIPVWTDLPGTDGKTHSLGDYVDKKVLVVVFTCRSCPTAADYEGRLDALARKYGKEKSNVAVIPVVVNRVEQDQLPALTKHVASKGYAFHYLYDESQKIAKDFGAIFTPECYVFDARRKLVYMGALDDSSDADKVTRSYVEEAITAALSGQSPTTRETIARGCRVRYARERRS